MRNMDKDLEYSTSDFNTIAVLLTLKKKVVRINREGRRATFVFDDDGTIKPVLFDLMNGDLMVNAADLLNEIRKVKVTVMQ